MLLIFVLWCGCAIARSEAPPKNPPGESANGPAELLKNAFSRDKTEERTIGPGVRHRREQISTGPLNINVVSVKLSDPGSHIEVEHGKDQLFHGETVSEIARREDLSTRSVVAAVNGAFWGSSIRSYTPIGIFISDGMIWRMPHKRAAVAFTSDDEVHIGVFEMEIEISAGGRELEVSRVNDPAHKSDIVLYTPPFGKEVPPAHGAAAYKLRLSKNEFLPNRPVSATVESVDAGSSIALESRMLVLTVPQREKRRVEPILKPGAKIRLQARVPKVKGVIAESVAGGPRILRDGEVSVEYEREGISKKFSTDRHPRTALGLSADGNTLYLVTVDGRQPLTSVGHSLYELAEYMRGLGCSDALNLDGGGSTTMVVGSQTVNSPSDVPGERKVSSAIAIVAGESRDPIPPRD